MIAITASDVAKRLSERAEETCEYLLPGGKKKGTEWCAGSVGGEAGESLKVSLRGSSAGLWKDFASDEKGGDLLDLWAAVRGLGMGEAFTEACEYLGIEIPSFSGHREVRRTVQTPKEAQRLTPGDPVMEWLETHRAIPPETIQAYRVGAVKGALALPAFTPDGKSIQYIKYRSIREKKFWSETGGKPCLFGWQAIPKGDRSVLISEGELDAMAWHAYGVPALSPTNGAGNIEWIGTEFDALARFDVIYLSMDGDQAGQAAIPEIVERLGVSRCRVVTLPHKDANECRIQDVPDAGMRKAVESARSVDPQELVAASDFVDAVIEEFHGQKADSGVSWPWRKSQDHFRFRPGEVSLVAGVNGHGKSELAGHFALEAMTQGCRVCVASMEFRPPKWLKRLAQQATAIPLPSADYIRAVHDWYQGRCWVFAATGTAKAKRILEVFEYAHRRYGIDWFVIDNLAKCGFDEDDYSGQKHFVDAVTDFARERDVHVQICVHMRKGESEDKPAGKMDIKGTGAIVDMVDSAVVIWRNKVKEEKRRAANMAREPFDEEEKPDVIVRVVKQRNGDQEPSVHLHFNLKAHQYLDNHNSSPKQYVRWSAMHRTEGAA